MMKTKTEFLNSKRDMAAGVSALHVLAQTVGRQPSFGMVTEKCFLDESIGTSDFRSIFKLQTLSVTFCFSEIKEYDATYEDNHNIRSYQKTRRIHV